MKLRMYCHDSVTMIQAEHSRQDKLWYRNSDILPCLPRVHTKGTMGSVCTDCFCEVNRFLTNRFSSVGRLLHYPDDVRETRDRQIHVSDRWQHPLSKVMNVFIHNKWRVQWHWNIKGIISVRSALPRLLVLSADVNNSYRHTDITFPS